MRKFSVTLIETVSYTVEVEAEDQEAAEEVARDMWADSQDPTHDFCGSGEGVSVGDVEEV